MKYPLTDICQDQATKLASGRERERGIRGERKNICRVEVVDPATAVANPSFNISASFLSRQWHGVPKGEVRGDCS